MSSTDTEMLAYRFRPKAAHPIEETIPIPTPSPDQVLIKILAAGVCHSDLNILVAGLAPPEWIYNFTMGHEGAGTIVSIGSEVDATHPDLKVGTYVAIHGPNSCEQTTCIACGRGNDNLCRAIWSYGLGVDGAWAEFAVVRATCAIAIPGDIVSIPPEVAAVSTDAVLTPYHALKSLKVGPDQTVLVIGCGGLGHNAIQIAKNCFGVGKVIGCDIREIGLESATRSGADYVTKPDGLAALIEENKLVVDVVVDFVGNQQSLLTGIGTVRPAGIIHVIGLGAATLEVPLAGICFKELTVRSSFWGTKHELVEVLQHVADGKIKPEVETRPMNQAARVLQEMAEGTLKGRVALVP